VPPWYAVMRAGTDSLTSIQLPAERRAGAATVADGGGTEGASVKATASAGTKSLSEVRYHSFPSLSCSDPVISTAVPLPRIVSRDGCKSAGS
jgi:hypothetical protein